MNLSAESVNWLVELLEMVSETVLELSQNMVDQTEDIEDMFAPMWVVNLENNRSLL